MERARQLLLTCFWSTATRLWADFVGRYREAGIEELILYWWREDSLEYGYERALVERCADRAILERLAGEVIPALRR